MKNYIVKLEASIMSNLSLEELQWRVMLCIQNYDADHILEEGEELKISLWSEEEWMEVTDYLEFNIIEDEPYCNLYYDRDKFLKEVITYLTLYYFKWDSFEIIWENNNKEFFTIKSWRNGDWIYYSLFKTNPDEDWNFNDEDEIDWWVIEYYDTDIKVITLEDILSQASYIVDCLKFLK